jgi:hypothetical protein
MIPFYNKKSISIHSNTVDKVSSSRILTPFEKNDLEMHYAKNASVLTELTLDRNKNIRAFNPEINKNEYIPVVFNLDSSSEKAIIAQELSFKISNNLNIIPFKKHAT